MVVLAENLHLPFAHSLYSVILVTPCAGKLTSENSLQRLIITCAKKPVKKAAASEPPPQVVNPAQRADTLDGHHTMLYIR